MNLGAISTTLPVAPLDLANLAAIPLEQRSGLPQKGGIYLAVDAATRVWYVGLAENLRNRLVEHDRLNDFRKNNVSSLLWLEEPEAGRRAVLEKRLIEYYHPPLNSQLNFNSLPTIDFGMSPDDEVELYLRIRLEQKRLELLLDALKPNIVTRCQQSGNSIHHQLGSVRTQEYKTFSFSDEVKLLKLKLSELQAAEKKDGRATVTSIALSPVVKLNGDALASHLGFIPLSAPTEAA